jgi:hypothetical protein
MIGGGYGVSFLNKLLTVKKQVSCNDVLAISESQQVEVKNSSMYKSISHISI